MEYCKLNRNERVEKDVVSKTWLVKSATYTKNNPSIVYDFTNGDDVRIIEVFCEDITGNGTSLFVRIVRNTEEECYDEFWGQYSDGLFENHGYIRKKDIVEL